MRGARWAACGLAAGAIACATPEPERAEGQLRHSAGAELSAGAGVVAVWADSEEAAWGRVVRARTEAPLAESRQLIAAFETAASRELELVVGGPYPALVEQVLLDALALTRASRLSGLQLVHVGVAPPSPKLRAAFAERGVRLRHRALQSGKPEAE